MPPRTQLFQLLPWIGGMDTSSEPALIPENKLANAENLILGVNDSKQKREGINKDWDSGSSGNNAIIGGTDFWYLDSGAMTQKRVSIDEAGVMRSYNITDGTISTITVDGVALSSPTIASCQVMNSTLAIAMDKTANRIKKWSGSGNATDLLAKWNHTTVSRSSSTTTRTIVLGERFKGAVGDVVVVSGMGAASYNGTFTVTAVATTSVTNDTISYTGGSSVTEGSTADTGGTIQGLAPNGSILQVHQGRMLTNDKAKPYRIHYSAVGDCEKWGGYDDSGVIDFEVGDNDQVGVTAIFPTFQGDLYVTKRGKLYRVRGIIPDYVIEKVSDGIGCLSQEAVTAVDQSDVIWVSEKGVHSLVTTEKFGDTEQMFLSKDIQKSFNSKGLYAWKAARKKYIKVRYLSPQNLVFFGVTEEGLTTAASAAPHTENNSLWVLNTTNQQWISRWPNVSCETIFVGDDSDAKRLYLGSSSGRIYKTFTGTVTDTTEAGAASAITLKVKTGKLLLDKNPYMNKDFLFLSLLYTPRGVQTITGTVVVDNFTPQSVAFDESGSGSLLGSSFTLGTSVLGSEGVFAPYPRLIYGRGRTIQVELQESGSNSNYSIEGLAIEYQPSGVTHEVNSGAA